MNKFFAILSFIIACECTTYSSSGGSFGNGGGYGGGGSVSYGGGGGAAFGSSGPITAAIETHRTVEVRPVQIPSEPAQPQVIEVPSEELPVTVHFKSQSSRVYVQQTHIPGVVGETEHTSSEDEPHRVVHEVVKPVIQEVREIIQPYRRLVQQIQPVIEQTHTIVAKGEPRGVSQLNAPQVTSLGASGGGGYGGSSYGGGSSFGGSSGYASRTGALLPSTGSGKGGSTITVDSSSPRFKYADSSSQSSDSGSSIIKTYKSSASSRARA